MAGVKRDDHRVEDVKQAIARDPQGFYGAYLRTSLKPSGKEWKTLCPLHQETSPSFTVYPDGRFHCFGCGEHGDGLAFLQKLEGLTFARALEEAGRRLGVQSGPRKVTRSGGSPDRAAERDGTPTVYQLFDVHGRVAAEHVRTDYPDGTKDFRWRRCGQPGLGDMSLEELPLYNLPALQQAEYSAPIFVCEGEKAAEAIVATGRLAVATVCGAASQPGDAAIAPLAQRIVLLWPDHDEPGRAHMRRLGERLVGLQASVHVWQWPEAPEHGDAYDFLQAHTPAEFETALGADGAAVPFAEWAAACGCEDTPADAPWLTMKQMATEVTQATWLWPGWIPNGYVTVIGAEPGLGKTQLALWLTKTYLEGGPWPDGTPQADDTPLAERRVTWLDGDHNVPGVVRRGTAFDVDLDRMDDPFGHGSRPLNEPKWLAVVREGMKKRGSRLLIIDTLAGVHTCDENSVEMKGLIDGLTELARDCNAAVVCCHHLRKRSGVPGADGPLDRLRGSGTICSASRSIINLERLDDSVRMSVSKTNQGPMPDEHLRMTIADKELHFEPLALPGDPQRRGREAFKYERCMELICEMLEGGPMPVARLLQGAREADITRPSFYCALGRLRDRGAVVKDIVDGAEVYRKMDRETPCTK